MKIDLTLVVQAINFFVVYFLLEWLLIRPAYALIQRDKNIIDTISSNVASQQDVLKEFQESSDKQWIACKAYFKEHSPQGLPSGIMLASEDMAIAPEKISENKVEIVAQEIADKLSKRLTDVD